MPSAKPSEAAAPDAAAAILGLGLALPDLPPHGRRVLVVGDLILDEYWRGGVSRLSPEAPVPILDGVDVNLSLGGAANVAANLVRLGCQVSLGGLVGDDSAGETMRRLLDAHELDLCGVVTHMRWCTTHKLRIIGQAQHLVRVDRESRRPCDAGPTDQLRRWVLVEVAQVDAVICADYNKGVLCDAVLQPLLGAAASRGIPVFVDPKGRDFRRYQGATVLTPNLNELQVATDMDVSAAPACAAASSEVLAQTGAQAVLVTCGPEGMRLFEANTPAVSSTDGEHIETQAREVFDVTGAGDTVIATLCMGVLQGLSMGRAAQLANLAAGVVVGKLGTASVSYAELVAAVAAAEAGSCPTGTPGAATSKHEASPLPAKRLDRAAAEAWSRDRRAAHQKVVFTNGCFDLLHAGHVALLEQARAQGDVLLVGLNSDASIRQIKGEGRPLLPQEERAKLLCALSCVDGVACFDELTPQELIAAVQPDVLVKGADYQDKPVVGRELVEGRGGKVVLVPLAFGRSTSGLARQLANSLPPTA
jgi:D-beta-D-heptose 7-phosphate kinase/D-beta-D-heptose 1-phosphate adenosyltransferase